MKMNTRLIFLLICIAFMTVIASNAAAADALAVGTLNEVTSDIVDDRVPVWSPDGDELLFLRGGELYRVYSNGSRETRLTETDGKVGDYSWSPDGNKILYTLVVEEEFNSDIWVMNADGSSASRLTVPTDEYVEPTKNDFGAWSPSGSKIAYTSVLGLHSSNLIVMEQDGSGKQSLAGFSGNYFSSVAWAPDASKLVFESDSVEVGRYIGVLNSDGSGLTTVAYGYLTPQIQSWQSELWSPDGSRILYSSYENDPEEKLFRDIFTVNADGSGKTSLTATDSDNRNPRFSPDGSRIVFVSDKTGNKDIWVMDADGKNKVQMTASPASDNCPVWSPDGTEIAFCSDRSGNFDIWVMDLSNGTPEGAPLPNITDVAVDPSDEVPEDETATISVTVRNDGGMSGEGYIAVSFPNDEEILSVTGTGGGYNELYPRGSSISGKDGQLFFSDDPLG